MKSDKKKEPKYLPMSNEEIKRRFKQMSIAEDRIKVLAELNACSNQRIASIVGFAINYRSKAYVDKMVKYYQSGYTVKEIAQVIGIGENVVRVILKDEGVQMRKRGSRPRDIIWSR